VADEHRDALERIDAGMDEMRSRLVRIEERQLQFAERMDAINRFFHETPEVSSVPTRLLLVERQLLALQDQLDRARAGQEQGAMARIQGRYTLWAALTTAGLAFLGLLASLVFGLGRR